MKKLQFLHPLLFAAYPVLFVYSQNLGLATLDQIWLPLAIVLLVALLLWGGLTLILRNQIKAGILVSVFLLFFFAYGHIFTLLGNRTFRGITLGQHKYVFPVWAAVLGIILIVLLLTRKDLHVLAKALTLISAFLVVSTIFMVAFDAINRSPVMAESNVGSVQASAGERLPDIYYIIIDECSRADVLKELYQVDISPYEQRLVQDGFYIASQSTSNYSQTYLSLASSLNFTYLDQLVAEVGSDSTRRWPLRDMIHDNEVRKILKQKGYLFVTFATGMDFTEIKSADRYLFGQRTLSEFENILLNTTPIPTVVKKILYKGSNFQYDLYRSRTLYLFSQLGEIAKMDAPTFTFAHVIACHPPFVFGENGEAINPDRDFSLEDGNMLVEDVGRDEYVKEYRRQLLFVLKEMSTSVEEILANSPSKPVIVIQADHGGGSMLDFESLEKTNVWERMSIFNAYYLPDGGDQKLYPTITPVNTFRLILSHYFKADLNLLDDRNYYSPLSHPYRLTDVTEAAKKNIP